MPHELPWSWAHAKAVQVGEVRCDRVLGPLAIAEPGLESGEGLWGQVGQLASGSAGRAFSIALNTVAILSAVRWASPGTTSAS